MSDEKQKHVHFSADTEEVEQSGGQEVVSAENERKVKSEELGSKANTILQKLETKRENDRMFINHFRTRIETLTTRLVDGFEKKLKSSYRDNEIQERLDSLQKIIGDIVTIEEHFRQMEESFGSIRQNIYNK